MQRKKYGIKEIRFPHLLATAILSCLYLFLPGCICEEHEPEILPVRTILFYMGGDNNLSGEAASKASLLENIPVPAGCRLLVFTDTRNGNPVLSEIVTAKGMNNVAVVREYEERNSASAKVFGEVLREVAELYPSPSYGLVLFSHASGWMPEGSYNNPGLRSVVTDGKSEMEISALADTIPDRMLDFIIFEACHMAGVEVAYELKDKTKYIIASSAELVSPGFAPVYAETVPLLFLPEADLAGFCRIADEDYRTREGDYGSLTLSLIKTEKLDGIATMLRGIAPPSSTGGVQAFDRYNGKLFFDLNDSYEGLAGLQQAIAECVIWKAETDWFMPGYGGFRINAHCGLTTYIPQAQFPKLNEAYKKLRWYKDITEIG